MNTNFTHTSQRSRLGEELERGEERTETTTEDLKDQLADLLLPAQNLGPGQRSSGELNAAPLGTLIITDAP